MNTVVQNLTGMAGMTDQVIATDCLIAVKTGIKNYAMALTETATPEIRQVLRRHLDDAINTHEQMSNYMISKGLYHPTNIEAQLKVDLQASQAALNLSAQ
jgi:similar to spore coat protein